MKISGVYKIQSKSKPERFYIGQSANIKNRFVRHKYCLRRGEHDSPQMQRHYNKYGIDDLEFSIIELVDPIQMLLNECEQYYIDSLHPIWNTCPVANSTLGRICSDKELAYKRSFRHTMESRQRISLSHQGMTHTEASKILIGLKGKGRIPWNKGKQGVLSAESRRKMSMSAIGRKRTEEDKAKIRQTCISRQVNKGRTPFCKDKKVVYHIITRKRSYVSTDLKPITLR